MEELAQRVWQLAYDLYPHKEMGRKGCATGGVFQITGKGDHSSECFHHFHGFYKCQSTSRWYGSVKKRGKQSIGKTRGGWNTKIHMVAASDREAIAFTLSPGQAGDAPEGRKLLETLELSNSQIHLIMDRAYEGENTRELASELGFIPVVPPKRNRNSPWEYDKELYKLRNQVERLFRRIKRFRRIFTRYDKLDIMFSAFIFLALILDSLSLC